MIFNAISVWRLENICLFSIYEELNISLQKNKINIGDTTQIGLALLSIICHFRNISETIMPNPASPNNTTVYRKISFITFIKSWTICKGNWYMGARRCASINEKRKSNQLEKECFRLAWEGKSGIVCTHLYPNQWGLVNNNRGFWNWRCFESMKRK